VMKFTSPIKQGKSRPRRNGDASIHLGKCNQ
jgi:hypothetical protein